MMRIIIPDREVQRWAMPTDSAKRIHAGKVDNTLDAFLKSGKQDIPGSLRITGENRFFMAFSVRGNRSGVYNRIDSAYRVAHLREIAQIKTILRERSIPADTKAAS